MNVRQVKSGGRMALALLVPASQQQSRLYKYSPIVVEMRPESPLQLACTLYDRRRRYVYPLTAVSMEVLA